jgi:hypothetical protein
VLGVQRTYQVRNGRPLEDNPNSPTINMQDAKENILKMKLQLEVAKPEPIQKKVGQSDF